MKKKLLSLIAASFVGAHILAADLTTLPQTDTVAVLSLKEATVSAGFTTSGISPLRIKTISSERIISESPGKTFPELIGHIPGVYATGESGSYGDAKINIRGFKQENISILLNGIPISGLTSGNMFWNNWMGLSDATASIQLQKGIGASMLSDNSTGGTINIITDIPSEKRQFGAGYHATGFGTNKAYINASSGNIGHGWAFRIMASYAWGNSFPECTDINSWSYLATLSKKIGKAHSFIFTALGSPERHKQRSQRLTLDEVRQYGVTYNKNWGMWNGKPKTISENKYFKPYFTLSHIYSATALKINTSAYLAIGNGGGIFTESTGKRIISFQKDGHIDWPAVIQNNIGQPASAIGIPAANIMSDFMAGHTQMGLKSSVTVAFNNAHEIEAGIHYQMYRTWEREQITDLLGADYWLENHSPRYVGDIIRTDNGKNINYLTLYALGTLRTGADGNLILKLGGTLNGTSIVRWDRHLYTSDIFSPTVYGAGGSIKAGALYKITPSHTLYLNAAAYSRAPYASIYFANGNNTPSRDVHNENNLLAEAGYRFIADRVGFEATFYSARWKNKSLLSDPYKPLEEESYRYMATGLNALHYGIEADAFYRPWRFLRMEAFASIAEWRWTNDVHATLYNPYTGAPESTIDLYCAGLPVGDAPQTQIGASFEFKPFELIRAPFVGRRHDLVLSMEWTFNDRHWADFDPASRTKADDRSLPCRLPSSHLVNLALSYTLTLPSGPSATIFFHIDNLLNSTYIERAKDGPSHRIDTLTGYWANKRNFSIGIRIIL